MKKFLLFLLFCVGITQAQIINFPDPNMKAALLNPTYVENVSGIPIFSVDTNFDGEIDVFEASEITILVIDNASISDLTGIEAFDNLVQVSCANNQITSLVLTGLTALQMVNCTNNQLTYIDVSGLSQLLSLDFTGNNNVAHLDVSGTGIDSVNVTSDALTYLDASNCTGLFSINVVSSGLNFIDFSGCTVLNNCTIWNSQLTSLSVHDMPNLITLAVYLNSSLTNLDLANCPTLWNLDCSGNQLNALDLSNITSLKQFSCADNLLTTLDVSNQTQLNSLTCSNNQLQTLYIKNGRNESFLFLGGNPTLQFVCADDTQVATVQSILNDQGLINTVCNSYCSFTPGGSYNTITGNMKFDANNNGCDAGDIAPNNVRVNIADGTNSGASFLNIAGVYTFYTQAGSYTISPSVENPSYFTFSPPTATVTFADNLNNIAVDNFCIAPNGVHHDAEMVISPVTPARPGFDAVYKLVYKNKGNQTDDLYLNFNFNDNVLDFVSATSPVTNVSGTVQTMIPNVRPFESGSIDVTFHVNAPTDTPAVNVGDLLTFTSFVDITTDDNWLDNAFTLHQTVVGSFDPNDITCLEGEVVPPAEIGNYLHYAINFENTGTFPAENVVVKTEVDPTKFDVGSLQLMNSNFPVDARITGNKVEFIFENIQLPIGGHGHILLKIKTHNALVAGDAVAKRADIFFDYNAPIDTGFANTVFQTLSNTDFEIDNSVIVAPNPASSEVNIKASNSIKSIELYDVRGSIISISIVDELESKLDISSHSKGIYFIKIITEKGIQVQKLLKD